jgi:hypothetical protein
MSAEIDPLDLLARLQPVRDDDLASESRSLQAMALFERIVAEDRSARRAGPSGRWLIAAAAGLATAGAVLAVAIGVGPSPDTATPAAAALRRAADAARAQDPIPAGSYLYVRSLNASLALGFVDPSNPEGFNAACCEAFVPHVREMWLGDHAGDALLREREAGAPEFLTETEHERWIALGRPELVSKTPFSGILDGLPARGWYHGPLDLPSDPDAIYEQFEQSAERDTREPGIPFDVHVSRAMFQHFSDVLREARATPEQRAAAYEALARAPGVILVGQTTDRFGRQGVAVAIDILDNEPSDFLYRYVLVFDPETAELLEERREVLPGNRLRDLAPGTVEAYATYEYDVVGALGERPGGQDQP